jgi:hypothetical protein
MIGRASILIINYYINDTKHVYFPDFMIKSENKIIEVNKKIVLRIKTDENLSKVKRN